MSTEAQTKKFQEGDIVIHSATHKALRYYPWVLEKLRQGGVN